MLLSSNNNDQSNSRIATCSRKCLLHMPCTKTIAIKAMMSSDLPNERLGS